MEKKEKKLKMVSEDSLFYISIFHEMFLISSWFLK